uniref:Uncharacterized protein n=1 Tax=Leersia perrieri TaxID=77586 RepID=A0A0D9XY17_9ORYZ
MSIEPASTQAATSSDITPSATAAQASPSPALTLTTTVEVPSADKGKQAQGSSAAVEPSVGSDSEKTMCDEIIGWRYGSDLDQVSVLDHIEDQKSMARLIQLMAESSDLVLKVVKNSSAKDMLLECIALLAEQAQGELTILRDEIAGYRNIRSEFKDKLRGNLSTQNNSIVFNPSLSLTALLPNFLGHDPAIFEAKKHAEEQVLKLQAELTQLQDKNEEHLCLFPELIKAKDSAEKKLAHAITLNVKSHEQANYYKDKLETLSKKHEDLKKKAANELSAMKTKYNDEFMKMKAELEEARRTNAELCQAAEPILDNLHAATAESNTSSLQSVIEHLQSALARLKKIILESVSVACGQTLAVIKSLYPKLDLVPITSGYAEGMTNEKALELLDQVDDMVQIMAKDALYPEEDV